MNTTAQMRTTYQALWDRAVRHPFIEDLGAGTLGLDKFRRYFVQDYLFLRDMIQVCGLLIARAPEPRFSGPVHQFLGVLVGAEDALFLRGFHELGLGESAFHSTEPLPTTRAFGDFLVRLAREGTPREICAALYVPECVYLDWANDLRSKHVSPRVHAYREWIDIHTDEALGPHVKFFRSVVDAGPADEKVETAFVMALRYEIRFWDMAYEGETWP